MLDIASNFPSLVAAMSLVMVIFERVTPIQRRRYENVIALGTGGKIAEAIGNRK